MSANIHYTFTVDGQAQAVSALCAIPCAGVYPRTLQLHKQDGPQDLEVAIDVDLAAGILIFADNRIRVTIPGLDPFEVSPQRPLIWLRDSILKCPLPADVKTIRAELIDTAEQAVGVLEVRVPELAKRVQPIVAVKSDPAPAVAPELKIAGIGE